VISPYLCDFCYDHLEWQLGTLRLEHRQFLDSAVAAVHYTPPITSVLHALKYESVHGIGMWCAELIERTCEFPTAQAVCAVPLHRQRLAQRGYNQAGLIGQRLAELLQLPYLELLERPVMGQSQASTTNRDQRSAAARRYRPTPLLKKLFSTTQLPHSLLLVDDVITTGSTLDACARVLKQSGVTTVHGVGVAHG
jgi:ComF family protein